MIIIQSDRKAFIEMFRDLTPEYLKMSSQADKHVLSAFLLWNIHQLDDYKELEKRVKEQKELLDTVQNQQKNFVATFWWKEDEKPKKEKKDKKPKPELEKVCPIVHGTFGADFNDFDECDECDLYNYCADAYEEL